MREVLSMGKAKQDLAYELYYSLGEKRSYEKVAELMGLSVKTIGLWGSKCGWQERLSADQTQKAEEVKRKREELECLGFEVAIAAMKKVKEQVENKGLSKELAQIYETFLSCPLSVIGETVKEQTAGASSNADNKIELVFDINGGVSSED
jgi:hypothetical protein